MEKRVALLSANKIRDLRPMVYLKKLLEKRGIKAEVFNTEGPSVFLQMDRFKPNGIVFLQILEPNFVKWAEEFKKCGTKMIDVRCEGTTNSYYEKIMANSFMNPNLIDAEILWGERFKELIQKYSNIPESRVFVCGNIRFDNYLENLMSKKEFCKKYSLDEKKKIVTYATGMVYADRSEEVLRGTMESKYLPNFFRVASLQKELRGKTMDCVYRAAESMPNVNFVIKVHPFEFPEAYIEEKEKRKLKNVIIIKAENIANVINVTDVFMHWNSTSSTEAWFLNKPTVCIHLDPELDFLLGEFNSGGKIVKNYNSLEKEIKGYLKNPEIDKALEKERRRFISGWYYRVDGKSGERVAGVIQNVTAQSREYKSRFSWFKVKIKLKVFVRNLFGIPDNKSILFWKPEHKGYSERVASRKEIREMEDSLKV